MKALRSPAFILIAAFVCLGMLFIPPQPASASTLGTNLLANPGAEAGSISSWTDETGSGRWFTFGNWGTHTGSNAFCAGPVGFNASGNWDLTQTISVGDQNALISNGNLVATLSGWYFRSASGTSTNRVCLVLQELNASNTVLRETPVYANATGSFEQGTISQAVMANTTSLKVLLRGIDLTNGTHMAFDDISLVLTNNSGAAPTIDTTIPNQEITVGDSLGPFNFTVNDTDTALNSLTVSAASSDQTVVTDANLVPGGSGANRTLSVTPVGGQTGETDITIYVSDGTRSAQTSFHLKINPAANLGVNLVVNGNASQPMQSNYIPGWGGSDWSRFNLSNPTFTVAAVPSGVSEVFIEQNRNITARHALVDAGFLNFQASAGLSSGGKLIISGLDQFGTSFWTQQVSRAEATAQTLSINQAIPAGTYFIQVKIGGPVGAKISNVSLVIPNDLPKISAIADQTICENSNTGPINFKVGYQTAGVTVSGTSSDQTLVPNGNIVFSGSGMDRTVTITPVSNRTGPCTITINAYDGVTTVSRLVYLTVNPKPRISSVTPPSAGTYKAGSTLNFFVNFDATVTVNGGAPYIPITLDTGGTVNAAYTGSTSASVLRFTYTVASGTLDLNGISVATSIQPGGATIQNAAGYDAVLSFSAIDTSNVKVDGIAPAVDNANPQTSYSALTHVLTIKISETGSIGAGVGSSAADPAKFTVWSSNQSRTLTAGQSSAMITDAGTVVVTIGGSDLTAIQGFTVKENLDKVDVAAGGIIDAAGNANITDLNNNVTTAGAADVISDQAALDITYAPGDSSSSVTQNLVLPIQGGNGSAISWQSDTAGTISSDGTVTRPPNNDVQVILTATISRLGVSVAKQFTITVKNLPVLVSGVSLNKTSTTILVGNDETLTAAITPADAFNKNINWSSDHPEIASVNSTGKVTGVSAGTAIISVTTQDGGKTATCQVTVPVPVSGVSLNKNSTTILVGNDEILTATIDPADAANKNLSWSSDHPEIASVDQTGKVSGVSAGTATITVTTQDRGKTATCLITVPVPVSGVSLNKASTTIEIGNNETLTATVSPVNAANKNASWNSDHPEIAGVDQTGKVTAISSGTATITVTTQDRGKTATCLVTVPVPVSGVNLNKNNTTINVGSNETLTAAVVPANATNANVSWSSNQPGIASVDQSGRVTGVSPGTATITVTTEDGGKTATCLVTVPVPVSGVSLNKLSTTILVGNDETLTATVAPADAANKNLSWSSDHPGIASVDQTGKVSAVSAGTATITVTTDDGIKTATCLITVPVPVSGVSLNKANTTILVGNDETLTATVAPADAANKNLSWSSDKPAVASVDQNGKVTAVGAGSATITVTTDDGGKTATCQVTVPVPVSGVSLNKASTTVQVGNNETLVATVAPADAANKNVSWSSNHPGIASVDQDGKVSGVSAGTAAITATTNDGGKTAVCQVTVSTPVTVTPGQTVAVTEPTTITIPPGVTGTKIDVDTANPLPEINVNASTTLGTVEIEIPAGTTVTGPPGWDGTIIPPTVTTQANATITEAQSVNAVVEVGLSSDTITFSNAVRLLIPGMAGKSAGYVRNGVFTPITRNLSADDQLTADAEIPADGDAKVDAGPDLAIWTKHFTQFVAYTPVSPGGGGGSSSGGGGSPTAMGQLVEVQGGRVSDRGVVVIVPAGTFNEEVRISIYLASSGLNLPEGSRLVGSVFDITLNKNLSFANMVTVEMAFDKIGVDLSQEDLGLYYLDGSQWVRLSNITIDLDAGLISGEINHFTRFAILAIKKAETNKPGNQVNAQDINGHWAETNIRQLQGLGAIAAYPDGTIRPDSTITRAEFAVVLVNAIKIPVRSGKVFDDTASHWARDYIAAANAAGIINGYDSSRFGPDDPVTREQMAVMTIKAAGMSLNGNMPAFTDSGLISSWARDAVAAAANHRVLRGYSDNTFKPQASATRAEAFTVIVKSLPQ